jgi:metal-sulfur cluster biosynthetic enzyme
MPDPSLVLDALKAVHDPEIPVDVVNLGLVYGVTVEEGVVRVRMTMTSPGCPVADLVAREVERVVGVLPGVAAVSVEIVWDPPWRPEMMSPEARRQLGWR